MTPVGKLDIIKRDSAFLHPHMAEGRTGHLRMKLLGLIGLIKDRHGLFRFITCHIKEFDGVLDVVDPLAQKNKAVIVPGLVEEMLGSFELVIPSLVLLKIIEHLLDIEDPLVALILHLGKEGLPLSQGIVESLPVAVNAGPFNGPLRIFCGMKGSLAFFNLPVTGGTVDIRRKHEARGIGNPDPPNPAVQLLRPHMDFLCVALIAIGEGMG